MQYKQKPRSCTVNVEMTRHEEAPADRRIDDKNGRRLMSRAADAYDDVRDEAVDRAEDTVRTYDTKLRAAARRAPQPVEQAVGRYPWAAMSASLLAGMVIGMVSGSVLTLIARWGREA